MNKYNNIVFWGCGGEGVYCAAKYFYYQGKACVGYDLNQTKYTKKLEKLGIKVFKKNPKKLKNIELVVYSNAIPLKVVEEISKINPSIKFVDLGTFYNQTINDFESRKLSFSQIKAFKKSGIAPLYNLKLNGNEVFIGITGTNGKTTTCEILYSIFKNAGYKTCLVSTISAKIDDKQLKTGLHTTTPSGMELYKLIKKGKKAGCKYYIIEATSQGLAMKRLAGLKFDYAVFTNVTNEHLDYHKTYKNYLKAKSKLITENLKNNGSVILNVDDKGSYKYLVNIAKNFVTYGINKKASFIGSNITENRGVSFTCNKNTYKLNIFGTYNVYNALACIAVANLEKIGTVKIQQGFSKVKQVKGRLQVIKNSPFKVVIDFAHTPDALEKALIWAKNNTKNRVLCVFGCAGGRDVKKRKEMGKIASILSDKVIITAEDPRYEKLRDINDQIQSGFNKDNLNKLIRFDDDSKNVKTRKDAIKKALSIAKKGDTVIICGKGHEKSMNFGGKEYRWSDIEQTSKLIRKL